MANGKESKEALQTRLIAKYGTADYDEIAKIKAAGVNNIRELEAKTKGGAKTIEAVPVKAADKPSASPVSTNKSDAPALAASGAVQVLVNVPPPTPVKVTAYDHFKAAFAACWNWAQAAVVGAAIWNFLARFVH